MHISVFDMYRIGIGPSSSHTVGPMRAGRSFIRMLRENKLFASVEHVKIRLMGSLAATGVGHATDQAVLLGLMGKSPSTVDTDMIPTWMDNIRNTHRLILDDTRPIQFDISTDMSFEPNELDPYHTNTMVISAYGSDGNELLSQKYYSVGGGFIETEEEATLKENSGAVFPSSKNLTPEKIPYPYQTADELMELCRKNNLRLDELIRANEEASRSSEVIDDTLDLIWNVMRSCIDRGLNRKGCLPGPLKVKRRANALYEKLISSPLRVTEDPLQIIDWINAYALAVSEENASGGRVVTAPTNGAAGVIPAVLNYYSHFITGADKEGRHRFLLVAGAIGSLYKKNASISGAEVGCQGEVGVACSMAAAGLAAALGATNEQIENAAEIGMEHHLGLTCDPVSGQVQIPCIERNAVAAVKAVNSVRLAMMGDSSHYISLDQVIKTMMQTGKDMANKYKETSLGGLAVCVVEC